MQASLLKPLAFYLSDTGEFSETSSQNNTGTFMDFHLGWMMNNGFAGAVTMASHSEETTKTSGTTETTTNLTTPLAYSDIVPMIDIWLIFQ